MLVKDNKYIYPPRPETAIPRGDYGLLKNLGYIAQLKYNDTRILIKIKEDGRIQLWNRHASLVDYTPHLDLKDQLEALKEYFEPLTILDGGLLHDKHRAIKHTIVIWDVLVRGNNHLLDTTYIERYGTLNEIATDDKYLYQDVAIGRKITDDIFIPENITSDFWESYWNTIDNINEPFLKSGHGPLLEGLVYKNPLGELEPGYSMKNNSHWMVRSRVETNRHRF